MIVFRGNLIAVYQEYDSLVLVFFICWRKRGRRRVDIHRWISEQVGKRKSRKKIVGLDYLVLGKREQTPLVTTRFLVLEYTSLADNV